jgi:hypothetical protein
MVPYFCGLNAQNMDLLVAAFEAHEQKLHQKELEIMEQKKELPVFNQTDINQLNEALVAPTPFRTEFEAPSVAQPSPIPAASIEVKPPISPVSPAAQKLPSMADLKISGSFSSLRKVTIDDFNFIAVLGRGAFGKVMLATEKYSGTLYAVKALKKDFIIQNDDIRSVKLEKTIFQAASQHHHPFLVNLHSSFESSTRIYFVMEYVAGGDLMCHIQARRRFQQGRARFYAAEVLLAIQFFHQNSIIYR